MCTKATAKPDIDRRQLLKLSFLLVARFHKNIIKKPEIYLGFNELPYVYLVEL